MADPQAPKLPDDTPQDVKDFFDCKGDKLVWKPGKVSWLGLPVDPDVKFGHGKAPGTVDLTITIGSPPFGVSFTLPMSVNANGELTVDTSDVPDLSGISDKLPGKNGIDSSIKNINDWFKNNGKKLKGMVLKGGAITLEKTPLTATAPPSTTPVVPPKSTTPAPQPTPVPPTGTTEPKKEGTRGGGWCALLGLLLIGLLAFGAVAVYALGGFGAATSPSSTPIATESAQTVPTTGPLDTIAATVPAQPASLPASAPASAPAESIAKAVVITNNVLVDNVGTPCSSSTTMHSSWTISGAAPGATVVVEMTGPGLPSTVTFVIGTDGTFGKDYTVPAGAGVWTTRIDSIGGSAPPTANSTNRATVTCQ